MNFRDGDKARLKRNYPYLTAGTVVTVHHGPDSDGDYLVSPVRPGRASTRYVNRRDLEKIDAPVPTTYANLAAGQKVRVVIEGTVEVLDGHAVPSAARKRLRLPGVAGTVSAAALRVAESIDVLAEPVPASKWEAGDVVIVRFGGPSSSPYTYVRLADGSWSGNLTDADADSRIDSGQAVWAMRGGLPVASGPNVPKRPNGVAPDVTLSGSFPF